MYVCKKGWKKKKVFRQKWTMTFQNGKKSLGHFACDFHSWSSTRCKKVHSSENWQFWSAVMRRKSLFEPLFFLSLIMPHYYGCGNVLDFWPLFFGYKGRLRFHAWQLVSEAVNSTRITLGWPIQIQVIIKSTSLTQEFHDLQFALDHRSKFNFKSIIIKSKKLNL